MAGDGATLAHGVQSLVGCGLDVDSLGADAEALGHTLLDGGHVLGELGSLQQYGGVEVHGLPARVAGAGRRLAREPGAVGAAPGGVGVGIVAADIAGLERSQDGVHDGVQQHVGVGVTHGPLLRRHLHAADHQRTAAGEPMDVVAVAHAQLGQGL